MASEKLRKLQAQLPYLPKTLALVWAAARAWTLVWGALLAVQGLLPIANVYLTRMIVNGLVETVRTEAAWADVRRLLLLVATMAGLMLLSELLGSVTGWIRSNQGELVKDHISSLIQQKSLAVDMAYYESPDYYDHLHRAQQEAQYRPLMLLEQFGSLAQSAITLVAMIAVLIPFGVWLPFALLLSTLPAFYVVVRYSMRSHRWRQRATPDERRAWYYNWLVTSREPAAEVRLFDTGPHFTSLYQTVRLRLRKENLQIAKERGLAELGAGATGLVIGGCAMGWIVWRVVQGKFSLGDLAFFYQAFSQGQRLMRTLLQGIGQIYGNMLFLGDLFEFLDLKPQVVDRPNPLPAPRLLHDGLRLQAVTFRYPKSPHAVLQNFSLTVPAGQVVAVVGANGAGKTTLIKLICRLYDPEEGRIEIDGVDLRSLSAPDVRRLITVLFQEPVRYNATVAENIALGDLAAAPSGSAIESAARASGADEPIARLPLGYDTLLGKWFEGGSELSVGEWQRLALARAFLRQSPIMLLDEPTSAMDSWAETAWMDHFRELARGRTALIITHRFTTAMRADMIYVMHEGRIVESGTHRDLLALSGRYAESWKAQMRERE